MARDGDSAHFGGLTPEGGTAAEFGEFVGADIARWNKIVKETGVKVQ